MLCALAQAYQKRGKGTKKNAHTQENEKDLQKIIDLSISSDYLAFTRTCLKVKQNYYLTTTKTLQIAALEMGDRPAGCRGSF